MARASLSWTATRRCGYAWSAGVQARGGGLQRLPAEHRTHRLRRAGVLCPGPPSYPYSSEFGEGVFSEVELPLYGVLGSSLRARLPVGHHVFHIVLRQGGAVASIGIYLG